MDERLQRRVQRYGWDKAAAHYELHWRKQLEPAQRLLLEMAGIRAGEHVIDIACGTGLTTFPAAEAAGRNGRVLGTDISDRMVEAASARAASNGVEHAEFARMDAESLDVPDQSFDVALCGLGLMYAPFPSVAVSEMFRVLKAGGRASAAVWGRRDKCGWAEIFPIVDARVSTEVCPMFFQLGTGDVLSAVFNEAGFTDVRSERISVELHYETDDDACGAAFAGGPVALAYSRFDEPTRKEAFEEYLASIRPYRDGDGYKIPGEFVIVSGHRDNDS
ncbi:MAG TPA: methyltransferase domain-containing protein [Rhodothermales bacterium]|nr:methyltransferase domain-containing protein [Rhodothermales bacterium]